MKQNKMLFSNRHIILFSFLAAGLLAGGCHRVDPVGPDADVIRFKVSDVWQQMGDTKATLFPNLSEDPEALTATTYGGGNFRFYAFLDGTTNQYASNVRVQYYESEWLTLGSNDLTTAKYYWPASEALNFFAFMPYNGAGTTYCSFDPTPYADPGNLDGYTDDAPKLSCTNLPVTSAGQADLKEYIFAYARNLDKASNGESGVTLNFVHPFSVVYFNLSQAFQRLTLKSVSITGMYNNGIGTYQTSSPYINWASTGDPTALVAAVNKTMGASGESALHTGQIAGPFIVMPQAFPNSGEQTLVIKAKYDQWASSAPSGGVEDLSDDSHETWDISATIHLSSPYAWEPGKKYTYTLDLGRDSDNVVLRAEVEAWGAQGNNTSVDVD